MKVKRRQPEVLLETRREQSLIRLICDFQTNAFIISWCLANTGGRANANTAREALNLYQRVGG